MIALGQDVKEQLGAAAEWRLLSLLFSRPREGWYGEVSSLAEEVGVEGLREAARAAFDALPLLKLAGKVQAQTVQLRKVERAGQLAACREDEKPGDVEVGSSPA